MRYVVQLENRPDHLVRPPLTICRIRATPLPVWLHRNQYLSSVRAAFEGPFDGVLASRDALHGRYSRRQSGRRLPLGVAAWERSVGRPSRNRLENGHANHHRYRITTPVLKMHLDRAATRISTYSVLAGRRWPPARQSQCRSRVARRACASLLRPTRYHRCGTADTPCRPKLNAIRRPGCTS